MARRLTTLRRGSPKHNNSWAGIVSSDYVTVSPATKVLLGSLALSNVNIDETVLRVIGAIDVVSDQAAAVERQIGAVGLIVVSNQAITAGAASIPGPATDSDDDGWFCHTFWQQVTVSTVSDVVSRLYPFVSKGRRVVQEGESIAIMAENIHASHNTLVDLQFRLLSRVTGT